MLNQPRAVICVPADIFEASTFGVPQMRQDILGEAVSWQNSNYQPTTDRFLLVIAQFDGVPTRKSKGHLATMLLWVR
jgi:hypothetical protein